MRPSEAPARVIIRKLRGAADPMPGAELERALWMAVLSLAITDLFNTRRKASHKTAYGTGEDAGIRTASYYFDYDDCEPVCLRAGLDPDYVRRVLREGGLL